MTYIAILILLLIPLFILVFFIDLLSEAWGWTVALFGFLLLLFLILTGCVTNNVEPEFKPLPPEKLQDFLYKDELKNIAYKSITKKDYEIKEDC